LSAEGFGFSRSVCQRRTPLPLDRTHGYCRVWTLKNSVVVLWPPPETRARVQLACGCRATVRMYVPLVFLYWLRIDDVDPRCRRGHRYGSHCALQLERIRALVFEDFEPR
jgi:hypothetical protein